MGYQSEAELEIDLGEVTAEMLNTDKEINDVSKELKKSLELLGLEYPF